MAGQDKDILNFIGEILRYQGECTPDLIIFQKNLFSLFQIDLIAIFHLKKILRKKIDSKQSY